MGIQSYSDLEVWQKSMDLVVEVYKLSRGFPRDEQFGLTSQIRRAAVSIPANIAEGHSRFHRADFLRFLSIARGSLAEVETQHRIAVRLGYLEESQTEQFLQLSRQVGRLLNGLIRSLSSDVRTPNGISEESEVYLIEPTPDP